MEISFKGKRALVTGAGAGIGRGIALKLAQCGATVLAVDLSLSSLESLKKEIPSAEIVAVDLSNWKTTSDTLKKLSPIDLLVNNAGVASIDPLVAITEEQYDKLFSVNVKALINVTKTVISDLIARKSPGAIVNISSQASKAALLNHSLYCATKGAVDAFTRAVALEYGPSNIRINCVNPTVVMTDLGKKIWSDPKMGGPMLAKIPLNRFAEIDDVVDCVLFLLSDKSLMITGSCVPVDGGFLAC
ncbi:L-xylulose reductase-like [Tribolium madens]|uniref:L-xylulose reductase-like n=1 Tax=Tribolium madens TaxID=41895 RepID=UPI001CF75F60|nr:L-xylulose reductase-like [Tribolium madens]